SHLAIGSKRWKGTRNSVIPGVGVFFSNTEVPNHETFGSASLSAIGHKPSIKAMWFRGGWFDSISILWREVSSGKFATNKGSGDIDLDGRNGGSIMISAALKPGEKIAYPIVIAWYFPNCYNTYGQAATGSDCCAPQEARPAWRPYYASQWSDAQDVAAYVRRHYATLRARTAAFKDALFASTLPSYVLDAVSANLAILKSPTVLRQGNGDLWGWEGCFATSGCCHGSCTHVWNYAQALPHLFPQLERTLREQEYQCAMNEQGHVTFRFALPEGPTNHNFHAAADGQLGGVMKTYREWQISGDRAWLERLYPLVKRSLDYCIAAWDPDHRGALFEPHHNTYDIEFWGPDGMGTSIYLSALTAMGLMARELGHDEDAAFYQELANLGVQFLDEELFNGEYFDQKVMWRGLRQPPPTPHDGDPYASILKKEGPKYQYGTGCLSDGVLGAWMATIYGIPTPQSRPNIKKNLQAIFDYNFKVDLSDHACTQRPGYALGHEAGLLLCTWPQGDKLTLPFPYSDEVWTGIEYQVASHLIEEGFGAEGLTIVKAARDRYDGKARNPWNEYECGNYYARAMSSYALLGSLSGFRYSAASKTLWFGPKLDMDDFKVFFSTASGFGTIRLSKDALTIEMIEGELAVEKLCLTMDGKMQEMTWGIIAQVGQITAKSISRARQERQEILTLRLGVLACA
ncbi:MAG: non-lysosomal glucosylceramidase, partial [Armatimonadota bacterium]|nr:non-lysosomal glucosylceramidase [Armatimonadota bacterium]